MRAPEANKLRTHAGAEYLVKSVLPHTDGCDGCSFNYGGCNRPNTTDKFNGRSGCDRPNTTDKFNGCSINNIIFVAHNNVAKVLEVTRKLRGS